MRKKSRPALTLLALALTMIVSGTPTGAVADDGPSRAPGQSNDVKARVEDPEQPALRNDDGTYPEPVHGPVVDVARAPVVIVGTIGDGESYYDEQDQLVYTRTTVHVERTLRGDIADDVVVRTIGGQLADRGVVFPSGPVMEKGKRRRLFLKAVDGNADMFYLYGARDGLQRPIGETYDTVPFNCPQSNYCFLGGKWAPSGLPVSYLVNTSNTDGLSASQVTTAINNAFQTWENDSASYIDFNNGGTTPVGVMADDSVPAVFFASGAYFSTRCGNDKACELGYKDGAGHYRSFDYMFNDSLWWGIGAANRFDVESTALHESGHAAGLGHPSGSCSDANVPVMVTGCRVIGVIMRTLRSGDISGIRALYTNHDPLGVFESANCNSASGWAFDPDDSAQGLLVDLYSDGSYAGTETTTVLRSDLNSAYGIVGTHGWQDTFPSAFSNGVTHSLTAYAINTPGGANPSTGTKTIGPCQAHAFSGARLIKDGGDGTVWLTDSGYRMPVPSASVFDSYSGRWIDGSNTGFRWDQLKKSHYSLTDQNSTEEGRTQAGPTLRYRQGSVVKDPATATVYVVDMTGDLPTTATWTKRRILATDLAACGITTAMIKTDAAIADNSAYPTGLDYTAAQCSAAQRANGTLFVVSGGDGTVYRVETAGAAKVKQPVTGAAFSTWGFNWGAVLTVPATEASLYATGPTLWRAEGSLIRDAGGTVYAVVLTASYGGTPVFTRRAFASECTLNQYGSTPADSTLVDAFELSQYQNGPLIPNLC
jgi:hypothetical protein